MNERKLIGLTKYSFFIDAFFLLAQQEYNQGMYKIAL